MDNLRFFEKEQTQVTDRPQLQSGDIVRVHTEVTEGEKTRVQAFEGTVLNVRGSGPSVTFTVRRETGSFGVERIFPLYSPLIKNIDVVKRQKVRRAKLTYLRQAGRRRFKEDVRAMQRHIKAEAEVKRISEETVRRAEDKKRQEEIDQRRAATAAKAKAAEDEAKKREEVPVVEEAQAKPEAKAENK